jgi:hypothetical protein
VLPITDERGAFSLRRLREGGAAPLAPCLQARTSSGGGNTPCEAQAPSSRQADFSPLVRRFGQHPVSVAVCLINVRFPSSATNGLGRMARGRAELCCAPAHVLRLRLPERLPNCRGCSPRQPRSDCRRAFVAERQHHAAAHDDLAGTEFEEGLLRSAVPRPCWPDRRRKIFLHENLFAWDARPMTQMVACTRPQGARL